MTMVFMEEAEVLFPRVEMMAQYASVRLPGPTPGATEAAMEADGGPFCLGSAHDRIDSPGGRFPMHECA